MSDLPRLLGGRYEVGDLIGRGGMAEVHVGHDNRLGRQVAIKMLRSDLARDASFLTRFRREAQSSAGLNHPSIVAVYDSGEDHGVDARGTAWSVPYIVMEYVEGKTLREVLTKRGHLDEKEAARITEGILDALSYSHRMGIVHRDIKPANVMIGSDGSAKVMDFGIARAIADTNATMTQTQAVIGTAQYLSPEQAQGQTVDARSDLYSTGCLLYELLTGRPPFTGDSPVAIAYQHVGQQPQPPSTFEPSISPQMDAVALHALNKDREARYQSAAAFRADLQSVRLGRRISDAALGTAAGTDAAATQQLSGLGTQPTEVYAAGSLSRAAAGGAGGAAGAAGGAGGAGDARGGRTAYDNDPFDRDTSSFPAIGREEEQRQRRGGMWVMITIITLLALGLLGWGVKSYMDTQSAQNALVTVPDVVTQPQATAELRIRQAGLIPSVTQEKSDDVAQGTVIRQRPDAQVSVKKGSTVTIVVSSGKAAVKMPDLKGKTEQEARQQLLDLGLTVGEVTPEDDSKIAKGKVVSSSPSAGEDVAPGSPVNLKVASGKVTVPNLVGKSQNEAFTLLSEAGLTPKTTYQQTAAAPENTVIEQDQKVGTKVDSGSVVTIIVAQANPPTPTPSPPAPSPSASNPSPSPSASASN